MGGNEQQFCLRWNNHQSTLISVFEALLESETLVDVTLAAEGRYLKAHKVVLCACSPFFQDLLSNHLEKYPIIVLKDVTFQELKALIDYMYRGEVNVSQEQLAALIKTAESLKIKGLADGGSDKSKKTSSASNTPAAASPAPPPPPPVPPTITSETHSPINNIREGSMSPISRKRRKRSRRRSGDSLEAGESVDSTLSEPPLAIEQRSEVIDKEEVTSNKERVIRALGLVPPSALLTPTSTAALLEPKAEVEDVDEESIDLMLEDETSQDKARPGPSHEGLQATSGFPPWHVTPDRGGGGEDLSISAIGSDGTPGSTATSHENRDDLDHSWNDISEVHLNSSTSIFRRDSSYFSNLWIQETGPHSCNRCGRNYKRKSSLSNHMRWECGKDPQFQCPYCPQRSKQKMHIIRHVNRRHREQHDRQQLPLFISPDVKLRPAYPPSYN